MNKSLSFYTSFFTLIISSSAYSSERLLEADINAQTLYNDNIFLTDENPEAVTGFIVTPSLSGVIREAHWETALTARLRLQKYSDESIDGNDQFFDMTGRYLAERNIFSLNINHDLDSNLSSTSTDFGIAGRRIDRKMQSITPQYTRLLTERSVLVLSYTYSDVDYLDAEETGFTPYVTENVSGSFIYDLSERDKFTFSLTVVDYRSQNDLIKFNTFVSRAGLEHSFTNRFSSDISLGLSRRNSTNLQTQSFDFFGQPITLTQEIDSETRGLVYDLGFNYLFETGDFTGRLSRDDTTNSFGGLDETNRISLNYTNKLSERWNYNIRGAFSDISSVSSASIRTDRDTFTFESILRYKMAQNWSINASYRYTARKFKSDFEGNRAPYSNRVYLSLNYNFPSLTTF